MTHPSNPRLTFYNDSELKREGKENTAEDRTCNYKYEINDDKRRKIYCNVIAIIKIQLISHAIIITVIFGQYETIESGRVYN